MSNSTQPRSFITPISPRSPRPVPSFSSPSPTSPQSSRPAFPSPTSPRSSSSPTSPRSSPRVSSSPTSPRSSPRVSSSPTSPRSSPRVSSSSTSPRSSPRVTSPRSSPRVTSPRIGDQQFTLNRLQSVLRDQLFDNEIRSYQYFSNNKVPNSPNSPRALTSNPININYQQSMSDYPFPVTYTAFETLPKTTRSVKPSNINDQYYSELFFGPISTNPSKYNAVSSSNTTVFTPPGPLETLPVINIPVVTTDPASYLY